MKIKIKSNVIVKREQAARDINDNSNDEDATLCFGARDYTS